MYSLRHKEEFPTDVESGNLARTTILPPSPDHFGLSPPGLLGLEFGGRSPYIEPNPIYVVTESIDAQFPEQLSVQKGDLVLKKFSTGGQFYRQCYEEDDYIFRGKFPHISDKTFENMMGDVGGRVVQTINLCCRYFRSFYRKKIRRRYAMEAVCPQLEEIV